MISTLASSSPRFTKLEMLSHRCSVSIEPPRPMQMALTMADLPEPLWPRRTLNPGCGLG